MPREKKDGKSMTVYIDKAIFDRLDTFSKDSGQSKSGAVERALAAYLDKYYEDQEQLLRLNDRR